jgi:hypothetical protein
MSYSLPAEKVEVEVIVVVVVVVERMAGVVDAVVDVVLLSVDDHVLVSACSPFVVAAITVVDAVPEANIIRPSSVRDGKVHHIIMSDP